VYIKSEEYRVKGNVMYR